MFGKKQVGEKVKREFLAVNRIFVGVVKHPFKSAIALYCLSFFPSWWLVNIFEVNINPEICKFFIFHYLHIAIATTVGFGDYGFKSIVGMNLIFPYVFVVGGASILAIIKGLLDIGLRLSKYYKRATMSLLNGHRILFVESRGKGRRYAKIFINSADSVKDVVICSSRKIDSLPEGAEWEELLYDDLEKVISSINITKASSVTIDISNDHVSNEICLLIKDCNDSIPIKVVVTKEQSERTTNLISSQIECIVPTSINAVAMATMNPVSYCHTRDSNTDDEGSVTSTYVRVPKGFVEIEKFPLAQFLLTLNVNIKCIKRDGIPQNNHPKNDFIIKPGDIMGIETETGFDTSTIDWEEIK